DELPEQFVELAREAKGAGISNVTTLIKQWVDGAHRYDGPGESTLVAGSAC
ncbi:MAG: hypothetical protein ACJASK_001120, partial [Ilumatobacter sp.]